MTQRTERQRASGRERLTAEQRALLEERLRGKPGAESLQPVPRDRSLPLSFGQEQLWFLEQLHPVNSAYNIPEAYRLTGSLDTEALERGINEIVRRHEILRTTFRESNGQVIQEVAPSLEVPLPVIDLKRIDASKREPVMMRLAGRKTRELFDLGQGPLIRTSLFRLAEEDHLLLKVTHHLVNDGWSFGVFLGELRTLYEAYVEGKPSPLGDLPVQYGDYAAWLREAPEPNEGEDVGYWKHQLRDCPTLDLPLDRPRPPLQTFRGARQIQTLPRSLADGLKALSARQGVTLFMTLLTAYQVFLHRYCCQEDIVVGTLVAGRIPVETEVLIGMFVNELALRTDLSGNPTFLEALGRVRDVALGAYAHQEVPFAKVVEAMHPDRDLSRPPVFQVMFSLFNVPDSVSRMADVVVKSCEVEAETVRFDLNLWMKDTEAGLIESFDYNTDLFERGTIVRMLKNFQELLEGIVRSPGEKIGHLPLLSDSERRTVLEDWSHGARQVAVAS